LGHQGYIHKLEEKAQQVEKELDRKKRQAQRRKDRIKEKKAASKMRDDMCEMGALQQQHHGDDSSGGASTGAGEEGGLPPTSALEATEGSSLAQQAPFHPEVVVDSDMDGAKLSAVDIDVEIGHSDTLRGKYLLWSDLSLSLEGLVSDQPGWGSSMLTRRGFLLLPRGQCLRLRRPGAAVVLARALQLNL